MLESYLLAAGAIAVCIVVFIVARQLTNIGWFVLELLVGGVVFIAGLAVGILLLGGFSWWYYLALYSAGWWCFFFVTSIFYVSISVQIIRYLSEQPGNSASIDNIFQQCIKAPFAERAAFLVQTGQAQKVAAGYCISPRGLKTAARILQVRRIFGFDGTGYYSIPKESDV